MPHRSATRSTKTRFHLSLLLFQVTIFTLPGIIYLSFDTQPGFCFCSASAAGHYSNNLRAVNLVSSEPLCTRESKDDAVTVFYLSYSNDDDDDDDDNDDVQYALKSCLETSLA